MTFLVLCGPTQALERGLTPAMPTLIPEPLI